MWYILCSRKSRIHYGKVVDLKIPAWGGEREAIVCARHLRNFGWDASPAFVEK